VDSNFNFFVDVHKHGAGLPPRPAVHMRPSDSDPLAPYATTAPNKPIQSVGLFCSANCH